MNTDRLVAVFSGEAGLLAAVGAARERHVPIVDVYTPYAVHGLDEALGLRRTRLPWVTLAGGLCGLAGAVALQVGAALIDWPLNVGGKPANSSLAFLPISFEATVLLGGLATAGAFFWRSRLRPGAVAKPAAPGVTDDALALVLDLDGSPVDRTALRELLVAAGAHEIHERDL